MRGLFTFKSIRQKMMVGFILIIICVIALGIYNFSMNRTSSEAVEEIANEELERMIASEGLLTTLAQRIALTYGYMVFEDDTYKSRFNEYTEEGQKFEAQLRKVDSSEEVDSLMNDVVVWREFLEEEVFPDIENGNRELATTKLQESAEQLQGIMSGHEAMADDSEEAIVQKVEEIIANNKSMTFMGLGVTFVVIILGIGVSIVTSNIISRPIRTVMERMNLMAKGDLSLEPLASNASDETGQLVQSTNIMNENMRTLLQQIHDVSETVTAQSEELTQSTNEVMAGTEQVTVTMQELASAAEIQANHATDLSTSMNSYTEIVNQAHDNGTKIGKSTSEVLNMTEKGSELMNQSTKQMKEIDRIVMDSVKKVEGLDESSQEISQLVKIIQDIAEQTNLLALNAAIEAARAGEEGQGFAVVAEEVRTLAEQVSLSVTDITQIVERIHHESKIVTESLQTGYKEVEAGTNQISITEQTFNKIHQVITEMTSGVQEISGNLNNIMTNSETMNEAFQEIAATSEESAAGVQEISASSEQTSSAMEEVSASSDELAVLAENLNRLIGQFKV